MNRLERIFQVCLCFFAVIALFPYGYSQIPRLHDIVDRTLGGIPELTQVLDSPTLTTGIDDAVFGFPLLDDYDPLTIQSLAGVPRSRSGAFLLGPGVYEGEVHSYCLKPGTYGPGGGDGYLYGPLSGPYADIVEDVLRESAAYPGISHGEIQMLLWVAVTRAGLKKTPPHLQWIAAQLLSPEQVFRLNGGALALVPEKTLEKALGKFPQTARKVLDTEARMRAMLTRSDLNYRELERIAILVGVPPVFPGDKKVPNTRWSFHPDGFLVRYVPKAASRTMVQVWVPQIAELGLDERGRIRSVSDHNGNRMIFEYKDTVSSIPNSDLRGTKLQSIRWSDRGTGTTTGYPLKGNSGRTWYRDSLSSPGKNQYSRDSWEARYQAAIDRETELEDFLARTPADRALPVLSSRSIMNIVHLREALRSELRGDDPVVQGGFELLSHALAASIVQRWVGPDPIHSVEFDPAAQVAVPANTGRQRLGLSARLY
jgi:hypothetical protein